MLTRTLDRPAPGARSHDAGLRRGRPGAAARPRGRRAPHPHVADAGAGDGEPGAADLHRRAGPLLSQRPVRRDPQPDLPPGRGTGGDRVDHAGRPQGDAGRVRARDLRAGARDAFPPRLLPVHRAERRGRRLVLPLRRLRRARGRLARLDLQGDGLDRDPRLGNGGPERVRVRRARTATTRTGSRASRSAWGSSGSRCSSTASPTCASSSRTTYASWSSSDEGSVQLAPEYCDPGLVGRQSSPNGLPCAATEVERIAHVGAPSAEGFVVGRVISAEQHPNADRLQGMRGRYRRGEPDDRLRCPQRRRRPGRPRGAPRRRRCRAVRSWGRRSSAASSPTG